MINENPVLEDLSSLENLESIDGSLLITSNLVLKSLKGLDNIVPGSITNLSITGNDALSYCEVWSICKYLSSPNGIVKISWNNDGCNSQLEIKTSCDVSHVQTHPAIEHLSIYPNPNDGHLFQIEYELHQRTPVNITVFTQYGEQVELLTDDRQDAGTHRLSWPVAGLPTGIYICLFQTDRETRAIKVVKL